MKKAEKQILLEGLRKIALDVTTLADALEGKTSTVDTGDSGRETTPGTIDPKTIAKAEPTANIEQEPSAEVKKYSFKKYSFEEARGILADKARMGFSSDVKAILKAHGVNKLSEITDPAVLSQVVQEAENIGTDKTN